MDAGIYVLRADGTLETLRQQDYDSESVLQRLIAEYPSILAGEQIDPAAPRRWLLVKREAPVPDEEGAGGRWYLDHLFLDQEGIPTLVEVKRIRDTRTRREVVAQMLDYAANVMARWSIEAVQAHFEQTCAEKNRSPEDVLSDFLGPDADSDSFWHQVKTNLQTGKLRLLFVADKIPSELRRIVEFLNAQMEPAEVLAVEIKQFSGESLKTLVPRVIGQTAEAERRKGGTGRPGRQWDEPSFFDDLELRGGPRQCVVVRRILEWAAEQGLEISWGRGGTGGSFTVRLLHGGKMYPVCCVHTGWDYGPPGIETQFQHQASRPPFDDSTKRRELLDRFNEIEGVDLPPDSIDRRPSIPLALFEKQEALSKLLSVFSWYVEQVRSS